MDLLFCFLVIERIKDDDILIIIKKLLFVFLVFLKIENFYNGRKFIILDILDKLLKFN